MIFFEVFRALWRMLERRRRVYLVGLIGLLFSSGVFEMLGMMMIYGFIRGLKANEATGDRGGSVANLLERLTHGTVSDLHYATYGGGLLLVFLIVKHAQSLLVRYHVTRFLSNLIQRIGMQLFAALATLPYEEAMKGGHASLQRKLKATLELLSTSFRTVIQMIASTATLAILLTMLFRIDAAITGSFIVLFGGASLLQGRLLGRRIKRLGNRDQDAQAVANAHLTDTFEGLVEARLRDRLAYFQSRFGQALGARMRISRSLQAWSRVPSSMNELLLVSSIVLAVAILAARGESLAHATPTFAALGFVGLRAASLISGVTRGQQSLVAASGRFRRTMQFLERMAPATIGSDSTDVPSYLDKERPLPADRDGRLHDSIRLREVSFKYPGARRSALRRVSLVIKRGQFVSFCGSSGSGKSTLVMLLIGLLRPVRGDVRCDDWSIYEHIRAWQRTIGYVGQSAYLSRTSVRENVAFGLPEDQIDDARVWRALEMAAARGFVEALPDRLQTLLSDQGGGLSGGQRQRILIARALYNDPDIVVFDEATAALDNVTEREITEAAIRLSGHKTVICVAHRLSTIRQSDAIFVLESGRLVGRGTYAELLATNAAFRRLENVAADAGALNGPAVA